MVRAIQLTINGLEQEGELRHRLFPEDVPTYKDLETQAVIFYSHIFASEDWNVHFHLDWEHANDHECPAPLLLVLWNYGAYFAKEWLQDGVLKLVAHFVPKEKDDSALSTVGLKNSDRFSPHGAPMSGAGLPPAAQTEYAVGNLPITSTPATRVPKRKREVTVTGTPDTISDTDSRSDPTMNGNPRALDLTPVPTILAAYPPLPLETTPQNFQRDLIAGLASDVPASHAFHIQGRDWTKYHVARKGALSRALLMEGVYGVDAQKPCSCCIKHNRPCRIFHPLLHQEARWSAANCTTGRKGHHPVARTCSWCIAKPIWGSDPCDAE